jgi:RNA polymerase sigma-70 factor (ECF subfamily)
MFQIRMGDGLRVWDLKARNSRPSNYWNCEDLSTSRCWVRGMVEGHRNEIGGGHAHETAEKVARRSYGKLVAFLAARTRDVSAAEDALSEAFAAALADWPLKGCPDNPEGWLLTVARRKTIDMYRARRRDTSATHELKKLADGLEAAATEAEIPDQRLALMFACAHPAIDVGIRAPLMLQAVLGLDAKKIASAFLMAPAAMGKRLVRAKGKIREAAIPFRIPEREELAGRLDTVLDAIYGAFAEGWSDGAGTDSVRRDLAEEAIFLCRVVTEMMPQEPEALGLLALMLYAESRRGTRRNSVGEYVPLAQQDVARWDAHLIEEAEDSLRRACAFGKIGRYQLEAALQSAHVERIRSGHANWDAVVTLYDALLSIVGSPVVAINRALAIAERDGPMAGLEAVGEVSKDERIADYQPYWAARAELLARAGENDQAREAYEMAIGLERDDAVRHFLQMRQASLLP